MSRIDPHKRAFLFGRATASPPPVRPPWALAEAEFLEACTLCGDCIRACPEQILEQGDGKYPQAKFRKGACTFCEACVDACPTSALTASSPDTEPEPAWRHELSITSQCLSRQGITCQSCGDACDSQAIRFRPQLGGRVEIELDPELCNRCGACISVCPTTAIETKTMEPYP